VSVPPTILVIDSGLGGLTVLREVVKVRPDARYVYVADDVFFPYGHHSEDQIVARVVPLVGELIAAHRPDLVVIACNTMSVSVMSPLRATYGVPFVGTVPAIKPACAASKTKLVSVLGTRATVKREYTQALIRDSRRTDTIVLACTHYPLLMDRLVRLAPWPVDWIDPAPAIARRVADLLGPAGIEADHAGAEMIFTSGQPRTLSRALMPFFGGRVPA
jgi:glutamate racemase